MLALKKNLNQVTYYLPSKVVPEYGSYKNKMLCFGNLLEEYSECKPDRFWNLSTKDFHFLPPLAAALMRIPGQFPNVSISKINTQCGDLFEDKDYRNLKISVILDKYSFENRIEE